MEVQPPGSAVVLSRSSIAPRGGLVQTGSTMDIYAPLYSLNDSTGPEVREQRLNLESVAYQRQELVLASRDFLSADEYSSEARCFIRGQPGECFVREEEPRFAASPYLLLRFVSV